MRDVTNRRTGFDRVLMAVAATFLTVSASSSFAQSDSTRSSTSELAIDAAVPRPEPANVPPPTASDFKADATVAPAAPSPVAAETKPADPVVKTDDTATAAPVTPAAPATSTAVAAPTSPAPAKDQAQDTTKDAAKPATTTASSDQPVSDQLREMLSAKSSRIFDRKGELALVEKFYGARNYAPIWTQSGALTPVANGVIARLRDAGSDGMVAADYPVPDFAAATSPEAVAEAELKMTSSMLDYARQAQSGRMHWSQLNGDIGFPEHPIEAAEVLSKVTTAKDASVALDSYNPPQKQYQDLKKKLAELRGETSTPAQPIADGPVLKFVKTKKNQAAPTDDARVPLLRARFGVANPDDTKYDEAVADAVRKFQANNDLKTTGALDEATIRTINAPKRDKQIDTVVVNMERWRWLPRELGAPSIGDAYVILNIPDFTLKVMQHGAQVWTTRVVVGKPDPHATPLMVETMKYITVNPTWNVPPSIIYKEYLPALQQDPTVLDRMGLKLTKNPDGTIHIAQPPGEANALGRIRFNFPNKFLVYQHDTPDKNLFAKDVRAYSHGCMRVQYPDQYAAVLLNITMPNDHYTPEKIRSMYGNSEIDLKFPTPIPVNITYQTAFVNDAGKLEFRRDVYGRDAQMISLLKNPKGKDLEAFVAHVQPSYAKPTNVNFASNAAPPQSSAPSFFERLFGGPTPPPAPAPTSRRQR